MSKSQEIATAPTQADVRGLVALYEAGEFAMAAERADALLGDHHHALALLNILGAARLRLGDYAGAEAAFAAALARDGNQPSLLCNLGTALRMQGRLDEAVEAYTCATAIAPDYAGAEYNWGSVLIELTN